MEATSPRNEPATTAEHIGRLETSIGRVVRGKPDVIRRAIVCLLARGHMLIEDVPGVGKTTLAQALARSLGLSFQRIQFTSDLLPSDILGISVYKQSTQSFEFSPGPIFAHVVLADEINRATPKTQSALLEAMSERKVSIERQRYSLPDPFVVLATQNPKEHHGTFPLPESQLDRFLMSLEIGYPPLSEERELLLSGGVEEELAHTEPVLTREELLALQQASGEVLVAEKLADYMLQLAALTRESREFLLGISTRGVQGLYRACQAAAMCAGRAFVIPDDVQDLAPSVLAHRVVLRQGGSLSASRDAITRILGELPVPL